MLYEWTFTAPNQNSATKATMRTEYMYYVLDILSFEYVRLHLTLGTIRPYNLLVYAVIILQ